MTFLGINEFAQAKLAGKQPGISAYRKVNSQAGNANAWMDLSMAAGSPPAQYYASSPLEAATLQAKKGMYHGGAVAPEQLFLSDLLLCSPAGGMCGVYYLLDFLLYYPFIVLDDLDTQTLDNTVTLPRYADGDGVMAMLVTQAPTGGAERLTFEYVDQDGATQTSPVITLDGTTVPIASIPTNRAGASNTDSGPFMRVASGTRGIRQVNSVQVTVGGGGLVALVLVKPILRMALPEANTPAEVELISERAVLPPIHDDAHLQMIVRMPSALGAGGAMIAIPGFVHT